MLKTEHTPRHVAMAYTVVMETALILFLLLAIWLVLGAASKGLAQLADALDDAGKKSQ